MAQNVYQFFIEPGLQELFRDKDSGLPLSYGYVEFYRDVARTEPKPVYQLTGSPNDPVYIPLANPLSLTGIGSTSDGNNNDIKWYYNPYDSEGNVDLYYIKVFDSEGNLQFDREGWPQQIAISSEGSITAIENFFQDGQFLNHINIGTDGSITQDSTNIAYGGWQFLLPSGFSSVNTVLFERFPDYVTNPTVSPRYYLRISTTVANPAEAFKDLAWINNNVNFLADNTVTLQFEAITNNGSPSNVEVFYQKIYGSGGSPTDEIFVTAFTINPTAWQKFTTSFTITDNAGQTIGPNDDDEIRFIFRFPSDVSFDISMVNFILTEGQFDVIDYPQVSDYQAHLNALASSIQTPSFDNSNEGDVLTLGNRQNTSSSPLSSLVWLPAIPVGACLPYAASVAPVGYLNCDGSSYDLVGSNSSSSYIRLFNAIGTANGYGADTYKATHPLINQARFTATRFGLCAAPNVWTSGFTINITTPGGVSTNQVTSIDTIPGISISPGAYFEIFSPSGRSSVYWFTVDGIGSDPSASFPTSLVKLIPVLSTDTADDVATKLIAGVNTQVQVPDYRDLFLRGWDNGRGLDPNAATRLDPTFQTVVGDVVGSVQYDALQDHQHLVQVPNGSLVIGNGSDHRTFVNGDTGLIAPTLPVGNVARISTETRPINVYVNFIIKT